MSKSEQYARAAEGWSAGAYADPRTYLEHRARLIVDVGPPLRPGDVVLDLACGDGGLGAALLARGLGYRGVDVTSEMVDAARSLLGDAAVVEVGDLNDYVPSDRVAATTLFRALYYSRDRRELFRRICSYTDKKLVFDLNPRQYPVSDVTRELYAAGFGHVALRPFLVPQTRVLPAAVVSFLRAMERTPMARLLLRVRFTYLVVTWRD
jgi:SAM-dependent methyltransferase